MADDSHLDDRYFIDSHKYNCPFCNRRHVSFNVNDVKSFNWDDAKQAHVGFIKCESCNRVSIHLTFDRIFSGVRRSATYMDYDFSIDEDIDDHIFHSIPSSFHTIDARIPRKLRELLEEAEGCLRSNFLTGASACARKIVYELAVLHDAEGDHWDERIKSLKEKLSEVDPTFFDTLVTVQELTSDKVHENAYDEWQSKHLRLILGALREALREIYVTPAERKAKRQAILDMKERFLGHRKTESDDGDDVDE